jgi:hypothetical protein
VAQRDHCLHRSLPGALAHQGRALVIAQRAGDDLRTGRGTAVDQHDQRRAVQRIAGGGIELEARLGRAALAAYDDSVLQELVGDGGRGLQHAARIATQIEHQASQPPLSPRAQARERLVQVRRCRIAELRDAA